MRAVRRTWGRPQDDSLWFRVDDEADELGGLDVLCGSVPGSVLVQEYDNGQLCTFRRKSPPQGGEG